MDASLRLGGYPQGSPASAASRFEDLPDAQAHTPSSQDFTVSRGDARIRVYSDIAEIEDDWRALENRVSKATLFQSFDWCSAWLDASQRAGRPEDPVIVTAWDDTGLILIWPLAIRRLAGSRILHSLGEPATQYSDLLIDPSADHDRLLQQAWKAIRDLKRCDVIELRRVPDHSPVTRIAGVFQGRVAGSRAEAPFLEVRRHGQISARRSGKSLNALRRHERLLGAHGTVTFEVIRDLADQRNAVAEAIRFKELWAQANCIKTAGYANPASDAFLVFLLEHNALFVARLSVGGSPAAIEIGCVRRGRYWSLVQSYDLGFSRHAPGRLLFWHLLEHCEDCGIEVFDFLAPADKHKLEWSGGSTFIHDHLVALTPLGQLTKFYLKNIKPRLRHYYRRLPKSLRRRVGGLISALG